MNRDRKTIDHDPDEPPRDRTGNGLYWMAGICVLLVWIGNLLAGKIDWGSVILGALTGGVFAIIMIEITGNKAPKWMR
ncbi:hypothetical protein QV13_12805 [Mesorhizobium hungaricum]|jgi:hypothetical protein|uniref:Uncharacterized protein n=1 Tax=Mesorhizobium hungaricum TaxID=1566387 RepID=A0A1C2DS87_9HYPH|nr:MULTISPECIES: hypothetical protein [Mesorhizobium]MBN9236001.1 hypothetical protein [Mesorhizobium sp.]OCX17630.1 hypothetical protein QV13_12805 [Mesorhizobium hungaricum]